jgi:hypothetical protein
VEIRIDGLEDCSRRLKNAPKNLVAKGFAKALDRAAGVIAAEVEKRTPIGPDQGELKENVIVTNAELLDNMEGGRIAVGFPGKTSKRTGKPLSLIAQWVELGHVQKSHGRKKSGGKKVIGDVPAKPFMRDAAIAAKDRAIQVFADTLAGELGAIEEG